MNNKLLTGMTLFLLAFVYLIIEVPIEYLTFYLSDDAYYYLKTANNIAIGLGPTFDGIGLSNGFHPQWMLLLLPIYFLIPQEPDIALRLVVLTQLFLGVGSTIICYRWIKDKLGIYSGIASILILLMLFSPLVLMLNGLESGLLLFWLFLTLYIDHKKQLFRHDAALRDRILLGLLLAGICTARLDAFFILLALGILKIIWPGFQRSSSYIFKLIKIYLPTFLAFLLAISPYFIWNYTTFGHLTPISGAIKSTFPNVLSEGRFGLMSLPFLLLLMASILYVVFVAISSRFIKNRFQLEKIKPDSSNILILSYLLGSVIHLLWTRLYMSFGVYQWHFVAYIPATIYFVSHALIWFINGRSLEASRKRFIGITILLLVSSLTYNGILFVEKGDHHADRLVAAEWVKKNVSKNYAVALSDAGFFAYFNNRKTINLDGLINSYDFQEIVLNDKLLEYFEREQVKYIADAYAKCNERENTIVIYAWRGKMINTPVGYIIKGEDSRAAYIGQETTYRPLTKGKKICLKIWDIKNVDFQRVDRRKARLEM
jgi:hypothetical protein